jgi:ABC-type transport system involved in multi-copper enzyme maturation permease subunit
MGILVDNPIIWREGVPKALRRADPNVLVLAGGASVLFLFLGAAYLGNLRVEGADFLGYLAAACWSGATVLVTISHTSRSIAHERFQGTWDLLVLSRLRPVDIVLGKLFAVLLPLWFVGLMALPGCLALVLGQASDMLPLLAYTCATAVLASISFGGLGLYFSMRCASAGSALVAAFLSVLGLSTIGNVIVGAFLALVGPELSILPWAHLVFSGAVILLPGFVALLDLVWRFDRLDAAHRGLRRGVRAVGVPGEQGP